MFGTSKEILSECSHGLLIAITSLLHNKVTNSWHQRATLPCESFRSLRFQLKNRFRHACKRIPTFLLAATTWASKNCTVMDFAAVVVNKVCRAEGKKLNLRYLLSPGEAWKAEPWIAANNVIPMAGIKKWDDEKCWWCFGCRNFFFSTVSVVPWW